MGASVSDRWEEPTNFCHNTPLHETLLLYIGSRSSASTITILDDIFQVDLPLNSDGEGEVDGADPADVREPEADGEDRGVDVLLVPARDPREAEDHLTHDQVEDVEEAQRHQQVVERTLHLRSVR